MLSLQDYLDQFTKKDHATVLKQLTERSGVSRTHIYAICRGESCRIDKALALFVASDGEVDPRTMCQSVDWEVLDVYYQERSAEEATNRAGERVMASETRGNTNGGRSAAGARATATRKRKAGR